MPISRPWRRRPPGAAADGATEKAAEAAAGTPAPGTPGPPAGAPVGEPSEQPATGSTGATRPPAGATGKAAAASAAPASATGDVTAPARRGGLRDSAALLLLRAAHPRQALLTAAGLAVAAALSGRADREVALVFATALIGQAVLGWHNDLVDAGTDLRHQRSGKPVSDGRLDPGGLWFTLCCAVLVLIPVAITNGTVAGGCYLASVAVGCVGNVVLRRGLLSFVPWALAFALYVPFLSFGGWGGATEGSPPQPLTTALAALLGIGVHLFLALWGLVADHEDGWSYLPLKLGLRMGATRLLALSVVYLAAVTGGLLWAASAVGLAR